MRLFIAYFPSKEIIREFKEIQKSLKQFTSHLKFTKSAIVHITLRFLGNDVSGKSYEMILPGLKDIISNSNSFNVRFGETRLGFPGRRNPRILFISTLRNEGFDKLLSRINTHVDSFQLPDIVDYKLRNESHFHFTLARTRRRLKVDTIQGIHRRLEEANLPDGFRVKKISIVESELKREGPEYSIVEEISLKD